MMCGSLMVLHNGIMRAVTVGGCTFFNPYII